MALVSARPPLASPPSSSSQADIERMFSREGSTKSTRTSRSSSLREIGEELDDGEDKVYVAVGKDVKDGKSNLLWASKNLTGYHEFVVLHVHQPADRIPGGFSMVHVSQVEEKELRAFRQLEKERMNTILDQYMNYCAASLKVQAEKLVIEKANVANGIVEHIAQRHSTKLVMGTSSYSKRRHVPKSKIASIVHQQAHPFCQIFFVSSGTLACTREAGQDTTSIADSPRSSSMGSMSEQPDLKSISWPTEHPGILASPDQPAFYQRFNEQALHQRSHSLNFPTNGSVVKNAKFSLGRYSMDMTPTNCSPSSSLFSFKGSSSSLKDLDSDSGSPAQGSFRSPEDDHHSMEGAEIGNELVERLQHALNEESRRRQKAEKELFEASMKFKQMENSLRREEKEIEERLSREKTDMEKEQLRILDELQKANEQKTELEAKVLQTNSLLQELQQLQVELQCERDDAVKEVERMRQMNGNPTSEFNVAVAFTEFTYSELKEATNNFNESLKIGEGGCGSVYKGFLRHTTVAIKKFNRKGIQGEKEFNDEVEILSRMRHPNLVTFIGACRESRALVYDFLPNGSLEDRLQCKHQTEPLSWRTRIRIATEICSALIFLHSNKPRGIAHGDLKPDNILLDANFVSKLGDFGISRPLNLTNTTVTPYHRTNQLKGTFGYMDPGYIASGELTAQYDVYSFGVVLLRLLTGKSPLGLQNEVEVALSNGCLQKMLDVSAGEWPLEQAKELADLALRCCRFDRKERPDLAKEAFGILEAMMNVTTQSSSFHPHLEDNKCVPPPYFICPMTQEIMRDPHIAADGFTYEGQAIKDWFGRGNDMSPMTYLTLAHLELVPNNALSSAIQEWLMKQQ